MNKNKTSFKSLNAIAVDPRVESIEQEGPNDLWLYLESPWQDPHSQTGCIHVSETTSPATDLRSRWQEFVRNPLKFN